VYIDWKTKDCMRALGDHVFQKKADEVLACKLVELGYEYNRIDLADTPFGNAFTDALRANPDYAIRALKLDKWTDTLSDANAAFLLTLPGKALDSLHKLYVDEAIESCMENGHSAGALRFIQLRAERNPLNRGDYTELMTRALQYGNEAVFNYVMEHSEEMDLFSIDFSLLAKSQALFETFAPQIMGKVYRTMDTHPRSDGTTFGRINQVFANPNEKAGLYLVQKYDLSKAWVMATKGRTLLMDVCHAGNLEASRFLIERRDADIHAETGYSELEISIFGSNRPTEGKLSPIFFAAKGGDSELIEYLKSKGANVNARSNFGTTPLMHAVTAGHLEATKTLVALHANVNMQMNPSLNQIDLRAIGSYDEISNAYRRAQTGGNRQILELLKKAGARP
ncbi:MAG: ankyrin repeat domain-containing protein, partial [Verrucomicrobiota bacterium]|nr:ankyrin repeat domain-containing protein [Verrucomicrobiota bacterium]